MRRVRLWRSASPGPSPQPSRASARETAQYNRSRAAMADDNLLTAREGAVLTLTINRPKVMNALNADTLNALDAAIASAAADDDIRAVVLTGSGDRAFVAGADINELAVQT